MAVSFLLAAFFGSFLFFSDPARSATKADRLAGHILIQVKQNGEAWYVDPGSMERYYLGRPSDAFQVMRELGLGISESDYEKFKDKAPERLRGRIMIRVKAKGEAYYVDPVSLRFRYLARPADAFAIMRGYGLGISDEDLAGIKAAFGSAPLPGTPFTYRFQNRVVYGFEVASNTERMREDCAQRQGRFNTCGSACPPEASFCAEVCAYTCERDNQLLGGDRDEHGCIGSAGYSWCEPKDKCLRIWEESCYASMSEEIRYLLAEKYGKEPDETYIEVKKEEDAYASGSVKFGLGGQGAGGLFLARKAGNAWELVYDGNGSVDCQELRQKYGFPDSILVPNFCD